MKPIWNKLANRSGVWVADNGMIITNESFSVGGIKIKCYFLYRNQDDRYKGINLATGESVKEAKNLALNFI